MGIPSASSTESTPMCARPRTTPPPRASPIFFRLFTAPINAPGLKIYLPALECILKQAGHLITVRNSAGGDQREIHLHALTEHFHLRVQYTGGYAHFLQYKRQMYSLHQI